MTTEYYNRKVRIFRNGDVELVDYQYPQKVGTQREPKENGCASGRKKGGEKSQFNEANIIKNMYRARAKVRDLVLENADILTKFFTLTYADDVTEQSFDWSSKQFNKFIKRLEYFTGTKVSYISVPELQQNGKIHYHVLCDLPYINQDDLESLWGYGIVHITQIDTIEHLGAYLCKYITKDFVNTFQGKRHFNASRNLKKPYEVKLLRTQDGITTDIDYLDLDHLIFASVNENIFLGKVKKKAFSIERKYS